MSIVDFIPDSLRNFFPALKRKDQREKLKNELDQLEEELKLQKEKSASEESEEAKNEAEERTAHISESIEKIRFMLADSTVPWYSRFMKVGIYIIPLVLSYFLGIYLHENKGLKLESQEVINPIGFYESIQDGATSFVLTDAYTSRFWETFPAYYFTPRDERKLGTNTFFFDKEDSFIETKLILKNTSSSFNQMISTLHVEVTKTEEPGFPWSELNTTPELERVGKGEMFEISNVGHAPALAPKLIYWLADTISEVIDYGWPLYAEQSFQEYIVPELEDYDLADVNYAANKLDEFLYVARESETNPEAEQSVQKINGVFFNVIKTPQDLAAYTEVIAVNEIAMTFEYESVKQESFDMKWTQKFDSTLYYFNDADYLLTYDEAQYYNQPMEPDYPNVKESNSFIPALNENLEGVYQKLGNEPEFHPEGVSLISEQITIDVHDLHKGDMRSGFVNPDQILNPEGYVIIYLRLEKPTNGTYKLSIKANSKAVSEVLLETLIPDETEFKYPESLKYFETPLDSTSQSEMN